MDRFERQLEQAGPDFAALIEKVPLQDRPPLSPDWLRVEMLERYQVIQRASIPAGAMVLEIGSGPHAISTIPLAFAVGPAGTVLAAERSRWTQFRNVVTATQMADRIGPVACDATRLPLCNDAVDVAVCVHGVRSLGERENLAKVVAEMLRVARRIFIAESLPVATNEAQRAHLAMYDLRQEVFEATDGRRDDMHYLPLETLSDIVQQAGGAIQSVMKVEVDLPHALAYFPRDRVESIPDPRTRTRILERWEKANMLGQRYGCDHPPVGTVAATRRPER